MTPPEDYFRPLTTVKLRNRFRDDSFEPAQVPAGTQAQLLVQFLRLYDQKRLLPKRGPRRLCDCCDHREDCWGAAMDARATPSRESGGIVLPWIGRHYQLGGVVVLAINPNIGAGDETDLLIEHAISWCHHQPGLEQNHRRHEGSAFAFGAMRSAAVLLDLLDGAPVRDREPCELVDALHRTARLQAVKCIPRRTRSSPTRGMWRNCPPFLLSEELKLLRPRYLLTLGNDARGASTALTGYRPARRTRSGRGHLGRIEFDGWTTDLFSVAHPAWGKSHADHDVLLRSARARGTGATLG